MMTMKDGYRMTSFSMPPELHDRLIEYQRREELSLAVIYRKALTHYLDHVAPESAPRRRRGGSG
jgi:hypothetical protein